MTRLCRVYPRLRPHELRRQHKPGMMPPLVHDGDLLRSMAIWRQVRRTCQHAAAQYEAHRAAAMEPVRGLRHAEFLAGCAALAADARRLRAEVAQ